MPPWLLCLLGLLLLTVPRPALAAEAPVEPAPSEPSCFPPCREGYTCHAGSCVSLCNPPCPAGSSCVQGRRCEPSAASSDPAVPVHEPPPPPVKGFAERSHTLLAFHLGLPGSLEQDGADRPLGTTLGFNLRGDTPIAKYVLVGPLLQLGAWSPDVEPAPSNNYHVDLDLLLRVRLPLATPTFNYQLWVGMPVGLTLNVLGEEVPSVNGLGIGWNIGVLLGGAVHFSSKFGLFGEAGWAQHKLTHSADVGPDLDFALAQACLNLGIVVKN